MGDYLGRLSVVTSMGEQVNRILVLEPTTTAWMHYAPGAEPEKLKAWLAEWVYGLEDRAAYWEKLGPETHRRLQVEPRWSEPVNYGKH